MSKKILTTNLIYEKMSEDGIEEQLYGDKAKNFMLDKWQAKFHSPF